MRNLQFLKMGSNSGFLCQKLAPLFHAISLFLIRFFSYFSRLQKLGLSWKKSDKDMTFVEAGREDENDGDKSELLHLKFKFPTFDEFSRVRDDPYNPKSLSPTSTRSVTALIQVLTTFPLRELNGDKDVEQIEKKIDATEFAQNRVGLPLSQAPDSLGPAVAENKVVLGVTGATDSVDESESYSEISSDTFLSDGDLGERFDVDNESFGESPTFSGGEIKKVEEEGFENALNSDFLSEKDFKVNSDKQIGEGFLSVDDMGAVNGLSEVEGTLVDNDGVTNKLESLWEHQELIEQLQMELRKVKATGLPTIAEEWESPKIIDDLKPWKIDENNELQHQDCIGELHRFYKSYREMMREFDILNYQKMYAMGFLQLKDPFQSKSEEKLNPAPMLKSIISQKLWLFKHKKQGSSPMKKLINELQGDVEVVYVGQMCLSWEFLHWQYEKALELWNFDPHGVRRYNEVAAEFQQFQVLAQRFTEDEPFQGPRVQSYVKTRCVLRNLLQVPLIREDWLEERRSSRKKELDEYAITSEMLVEMIEESIRIFWEFVGSDKDCGVVSNSKLPELHSPQDLNLFIQLRRLLLKKERKLKDVLRSEKCIFRKFRKHDSEQALHFFAQVDVKLVSRVLNMSRITRDQLIWCQNKLGRISFVNRKIYILPAFLLFPC